MMFPKDSRFRDQKYMDYLKTQPCIFTGAQPSEYMGTDPAHMGTAGTGIKGHDYWCLPVSHKLHQEMGQTGEMSVVRKHIPNDVLLSALRALAKQHFDEWKDE
jgi:hypothetical protein